MYFLCITTMLHKNYNGYTIRRTRRRTHGLPAGVYTATAPGQSDWSFAADTLEHLHRAIDLEVSYRGIPQRRLLIPATR